MKNKKAFILYKYNNFVDDFEFIAEYYNLKELQEKEKDILQLKNKNSIYHSITNSIDNIKQLLNNKYIIIKEDI